MSVNFSTISQMSASTVSRPPAFSNESPNSAPAPQTAPVASSSLNSGYQKEKKSGGWILGTLGAVVFVVGGLAAARKWAGFAKDVDLAKELSKEAKVTEKCKFYTAKAGQYIIDKGVAVKDWVVKLFNREAKEVKK